jgi:hypothetical protein
MGGSRRRASCGSFRWYSIWIADGSLHLTAVCLLGPHLTVENHEALLAAAHHKSKREVEELVAELRPKPPVPATIRRLPQSRGTVAAGASLLAAAEGTESKLASEAPTTDVVAPSKELRAEVKPLAPERYRVQFTASRETYDKLRLAQDLLRHAIPGGDVAAVVDRALTVLINQMQKSRHAAVARPRRSPISKERVRRRHVPAAVKRDVWRRDGGRCAFVGAHGRCMERGLLEYHHRIPYADGGPTTADNLELRWRAHNAFEAERWFGRR